MHELRSLLRALGYVHAAEFLPDLPRKQVLECLAAWKRIANR